MTVKEKQRKPRSGLKPEPLFTGDVALAYGKKVEKSYVRRNKTEFEKDGRKTKEWQLYSSRKTSAATASYAEWKQ